MAQDRKTNTISGKKPLQLVGEPRIDEYELKSALTGYIVEVRHNLETGECEYRNTDRTEYRVPDDAA